MNAIKVDTREMGGASAVVAPGLQIRNLKVAFPSADGWTEVVHGIDIDLYPGETLAVVGESGSGKSVTAMSVLGLLPPKARVSGSLLLDGENLLAVSPQRLRQIRGGVVGMIFQEPMTALNPVYSVGNQIVAAIRAHRRMGRQEARARAIELLRQVHMPAPEEKFTRYPHQLSGGQRQRAMIAMAIAAEPRILIADEPTTALDVTVQAEILDLLRELQARLGMSIMIITHDMGVVADMASRVVVMQHGNVVEAAPVTELFAAPAKDYTRTLLAAVPRMHERLSVAAVDTVAAPVLDVRDLQVRYGATALGGGFLAVSGVSFDVRAGEVVGLVGESGSGKSTIGRAVIGLAPASATTLDVNGKDVRRASGQAMRQLRRHVSIVFQDPASSLNPRATIGSNITSPLRWNGVEHDPRKLDATGRELLERVNLPGDWIHRFPHELSGGQRQRVSIARAIAMRPSLMIADEPTSALDVTVQATIIGLLKQLQRDFGFACLFISHDLSLVQQLSQRVVVLRDGKVVEQGSTSTVLSNPAEAYTRALLAAAPVPDPELQRQRRLARHALRADRGLTR